MLTRTPFHFDELSENISSFLPASRRTLKVITKARLPRKSIKTSFSMKKSVYSPTEYFYTLTKSLIDLFNNIKKIYTYKDLDFFVVKSKSIAENKFRILVQNSHVQFAEVNDDDAGWQKYVSKMFVGHFDGMMHFEQGANKELIVKNMKIFLNSTDFTIMGFKSLTQDDSDSDSDSDLDSCLYQERHSDTSFDLEINYCLKPQVALPVSKFWTNMNKHTWHLPSQTQP